MILGGDGEPHHSDPWPQYRPEFLAAGRRQIVRPELAHAVNKRRSDLIVRLAERHKLPAVYADRLSGGLISYGPDIVSACCQAMLIASLRAKGPPIFRCKHRPRIGCDQPQDRKGAGSNGVAFAARAGL